MPTIHYIRSYPSFPSVIPIHTASSLRVTHPSAMIPLPEGSLLIDLHVLSILSAFILSQDQTLHSIFISLHYLNFFFLTWRLFLLLLFSLSFASLAFRRRQDIYYQILFFLSTLFLKFFLIFIEKFDFQTYQSSTSTIFIDFFRVHFFEKKYFLILKFFFSI